MLGYFEPVQIRIELAIQLLMLIAKYNLSLFYMQFVFSVINPLKPKRELYWKAEE
jgi:hypothetical protein